MATRNRILRVLVTAPDAQSMRAFLREHGPDVACGGPKRREDGTFVVEIYVPEETTNQMKKSLGPAPRAAVKIRVIEDATAKGRARQKEVGKGNRFVGKNRVPRGIGRKVKADGNAVP